MSFLVVTDKSDAQSRTLGCATRMLHDLHGSVSPCRAMTSFRQCLHPAAGVITDKHLPFSEVTEGVVCL